MAPDWTREASIKAIWTQTDESPEWIAARLDAFVRAAGDLTGIERWRLSDDTSWEGDERELADIVRRFPSAGSTGAPQAAEGYVLSVAGTGAHDVFLQATVTAGDPHVGRRVPMHSLVISMSPKGDTGLPAGVAAALTDAVAEAFEPSMVRLASRAVGRTARRGDWLIPPAYRLWLHRDVAAELRPADGVVAQPLGAGTVLSVPDDWEPQQVVDAMLATFAASGIDEILH